MLKNAYALIAALLFAGSAYGGELVNVSGASGIAVNGYDPVAFFTAKKPVHGNPGIKVEYQGAAYLFSSEENKALFEKDPKRYAPQFGGFCAYGVAVNALFPMDVNTWQVRDGKLYLNLNPEILQAFNADFGENVKKAHDNWAGLKSKHAE